MINNKVKNRLNGRLLIFGRATSTLGNIIFDYANNVSIVMQFSNKPWLLAFYQGVETIVHVLFNLIGGVKADKGKKKKIIILTDVISGSICLFALWGTNSNHVAYTLIIANALLALVYAFNSPTYKAIVRIAVERERINAYNSISNGINEVIKIAGPLIGVTLVRVIGVKGALVFDAATFFVSALSESLITITEDIEKNNIFQSRATMVKNIKEGFVYLYYKKQILFLIILSALVNFFLAGYNLLIPYTDIMYIDRFPGFYSKVLFAEALGGLTGSLINTKLGKTIKDDINAQICSLGCIGGMLIFEPILMHTNNMIICLLPFWGFGISLTIFNIQFVTYVQIHVDEDYLGRVFSIIYTIAVLFMPLGSLFFSFVCDVNSINSFGLIGCGIVSLSIGAFCLCKLKKTNHSDRL